MKSIVFCSSQRFKRELAEFVTELKRLANERDLHLTVLEPNFENSESHLSHLPERERMRDNGYRITVAGKVYDHLFRKVKVADICFIFNKNGYIGANTNGELFAAAIAGKLIYSLENEMKMGEYPDKLYEEASSKKLVHEVVNTPKNLLNRLI